MRSASARSVVRRIDADLADAYRWERRGLYLRTIWFPTAEFAYALPVAAALAWGGWLVSQGNASIAEVTAIALYVAALADPVDRLISWLDEIQVGATSFARLVGVAKVPPDRAATDDQPDDDRLRAHDVRYAYVDDRDVLHGIDLELAPGERVAVVGPSGAGKSTLGRLLAGIHPPRAGRVDVGGVRLVDLPLETLRQEVALVTQEQHVFVGTLAENLRLGAADAGDDELVSALAAVDALDWAEALPDGLATTVGAGGHPLSPAQAQQLALARLVLADPHTLVLDEATSLLDPRAARHLERSLGLVLQGGRSSRSRTDSTPLTTLTVLPWSRTGCSASSGRTTSSSPARAPTPPSGSRGTASASGRVSRPRSTSRRAACSPRRAPPPCRPRRASGS